MGHHSNHHKIERLCVVRAIVDGQLLGERTIDLIVGNTVKFVGDMTLYDRSKTSLVLIRCRSAANELTQSAKNKPAATIPSAANKQMTAGQKALFDRMPFLKTFYPELNKPPAMPQSPKTGPK